MKFYYQKNTGTYFLSIGGDVYSSKETGSAKKEGTHILKNAVPAPKEIKSNDVPKKVKVKFERKIKTLKKPYVYVAESIIEIQEEVTIEQEGERIILEKGDRIKVLKESNSYRSYEQNFDANKTIAQFGNRGMKVGISSDVKKFNEEVEVKKVIKDLSKSYGDSNEEQGKMVALMKGLAFSDDAEANKFMKALDKWTTEYSKGIEE
jgi:hypothetical protein